MLILDRSIFQRAKATAHSVFLVGMLVVNVAAAHAQSSDCDVPVDVMKQRISGTDQPLANRAAHCIAGNPSEFADTFLVIADVIRRSQTSATVKEAAVWAAGRIAENQRVDGYAADTLARELTALVRNRNQPISLRKVSAYTLGRLAESLPAADSTHQTTTTDAVAALVETLTNRSEDWKQDENLALVATATGAIGNFGLQGRPAVPAIIHFLQDSSDIAKQEDGGTRGRRDGIVHLEGVMAAILGSVPSDLNDSTAGLALLAQTE
jgi:hypothetical protein